MAIKLYKSQLTPTAESSNVANTNRISMSEVQSIGKAWKGMVQAGEQLYVTHQDIKTDNEILEKSKEVMNGTDNYTGLSETTINASQMKDPDAAGKLYNDEWQKIFDNVSSTLSGRQAKRKFKAFMIKQNTMYCKKIVRFSINFYNMARGRFRCTVWASRFNWMFYILWTIVYIS